MSQKVALVALSPCKTQGSFFDGSIIINNWLIAVNDTEMDQLLMCGCFCS